jgi:hypothetical protein
LFSVTVNATDGRENTAVVEVTILAADFPTIKVAGPTTSVSLDKKVTIVGLATTTRSDRSLANSWSVVTSPQPVLTAITPMSKTFSVAEVNKQVKYSLGYSAYAMAPGFSYTFRLTSFPVGFPALVSYGEFTVTVNKIPTGESSPLLYVYLYHSYFVFLLLDIVAWPVGRL